MLETAAACLASLAELLARSLARVLVYPVDPGERIFWLYLATSLAMAFGVYLRARRQEPGRPGPGGFLRFCFPARVWRHPSAWLDLRYFVVQQMVRVWIYGALATAVALESAGAVAAGLRWLGGEPPAPAGPIGLGARVCVTLFAVAATDFAAFLAHWLQHRVPLLWAFHKVHHSASVLHPLSNYREHWVDNLLYALAHGATAGAATSLAAHLAGRSVGALEVLGVNALVFAWNAAGYNLRHSHLWVAWPGWLGWLVGSPAYHQIHHSVDPRHLDKNFAFLFPVWDRLFGCAYLPREPEPLRFGLAGGGEDAYRSVLRLWLLPFAELLRRPRPGAAAEAGLQPQRTSPR